MDVPAQPQAARPPPPWRRGALAFLVLLAVVLFLRWPTFGFNVWNVDEAIHAGVARTLLDGGVMYRDAIDQRTPLTYYVVAAIFAVAGENNMWAVRAFIAVLIAGTACAVFLLASLWRGGGAGPWAAAVYVAFSTTLLYAGDANAANTEWFVGFFTAWGAWLFWRAGPVPSLPAALGAGACYSAAFLSKQPALLELGAPLGLLLLLGFMGRAPWPRIAGALLGICAGYIVIVAAVFGYFAAEGALPDFYFYAWTYNLVYYGPEVSLGERVQAAAALAGIVAGAFPLLLVAISAALLGGVLRVGQLRPTAAESAARPVDLFLGAWLLLALAGAASAGRVYGHYYIQVLGPLALVAGLGLAALTRATLAARRPARLAGLAALAAVAATLVWHPLAHGRKGAHHSDPAGPIAAAVRAHTAPDERIFVWGWNPDIYLYADRKPASRFLYCSFLTGLVPWTNLQPGLDTSYAIVPGTMDTLLREIEERRPTMIIDCSVGPHRQFQKYPIELYPRLRDLIARHYVEFEKRPFRHRGFRVFLIRDGSRRTPLPASPGAPARLEPPALFGPASVGPVPTSFELVGRDPAGRLRRLELLVNGAPLESASFVPSPSVALTVAVPFDRLGPGTHTLVVRAHGADGSSVDSAPQTVVCGAADLPPERLAALAIPHVAALLAPVQARAPFGADVLEEAGRRMYFAHAPSSFTYPIRAESRSLRGFFAIRPGAYAPSNPGPTDGAEFVVDWIEAAGSRRTLFRRLLNPREVEADRGEQAFEVALPGRAGRIELLISPGPAGNAASDWTYWSELLLTDAR
jgi:4-amino-4-deoxy-L-arabinose transferase-like glycosyltransferase